MSHSDSASCDIDTPNKNPVISPPMSYHVQYGYGVCESNGSPPTADASHNAEPAASSISGEGTQVLDSTGPTLLVVEFGTGQLVHFQL